MAKKKVAKKKAKKAEPKLVKDAKQKGEQIPLIDVTPVYAKKLITAAKLYKELQAERMDALEAEIAQKKVVCEIMHDKVDADDNGNRKFEYEGLKITVTPRDELVKVVKKKETIQLED